MTTITNTRAIDVEALNGYLATQQMEISNGYGVYKDKAFRIAHMGEVTEADLDRLFAAMEQFLETITIMTTRMIDLRSDTVTKPTPAMRRAMAEAARRRRCFWRRPHDHPAGRAGGRTAWARKRRVFVPSGTMGNLISVLSHCGRGDEMILGDKAHIFLYEQGGAAALGGVQPNTVPNQPDGTLDLD